MHHNTTRVNTTGEIERVAPIPSIDDFFGMSAFFEQKIDANSGTPMAEGGNLSSIIVSRRGLYALRIIDSQKALEFYDYLTSGAENSKGKTYLRVISDGFIANVIEQTKAQCGACNENTEDALFELNLINFIKKIDSGIGLFVSSEIDSNGNYIWKFLTN